MCTHNESLKIHKDKNCQLGENICYHVSDKGLIYNFKIHKELITQQKEIQTIQ